MLKDIAHFLHTTTAYFAPKREHLWAVAAPRLTIHRGVPRELFLPGAYAGVALLILTEVID